MKQFIIANKEMNSQENIDNPENRSSNHGSRSGSRLAQIRNSIESQGTTKVSAILERQDYFYQADFCLFQSKQSKAGFDVQLFVEGKNLVDLDLITMSDPICVLRSRDPNHPDTAWKFEGETEVIDNNLNPVFIEHFNVYYNLKKDTELLFQVSNHNP